MATVFVCKMKVSVMPKKYVIAYNFTIAIKIKNPIKNKEKYVKKSLKQGCKNM